MSAWFILILIAELIAFTVSYWAGLAILPMILLFLWLDLIIYAASKPRARVCLLFFGISFFNFLLGREFLEALFGYEVEFFPENVIYHTEISLIISLLTIMVSYFFFEHVSGAAKEENKYTDLQQLISAQTPKVLYLQKTAEILFYVALVMSLAYRLILGYVSYSTSYYESYMETSRISLYGNLFVRVVEIFDQMLPIFLVVFWASFPEKKRCRRVVLLYAVYLAVCLLRGSRSMSVLGLLWIIVYYVYRDGVLSRGKKKVTKRRVFIGLALSPIALVCLSAIESIRAGERFRLSGGFHTLVDYFYHQGVSVNVIKRSYEYAAKLPAGKYYSLTGFTESVIGRIIGVPQYSGNSVAHATQGNNLAHALSYLIMPGEYLEGRGSGTSYIAELYHDFGYLGIILGNVLFGYLLVKAIRLKTNSVFLNALILLTIRQLLWSPRGGFSEFILVPLKPVSIVAFIAVWLGAKLLFRKEKKNGERKEESLCGDPVDATNQ